MSRVLLLVILGALLLLPAAADAAGSTDVVVSQVYGGGGNAGATFGTTTSSSSTPGPAPSTWRAGRLQYATAAVTDVAADRPRGIDRAGPLVPGPAGIERRRRRRSADAGRDRNEQPRRGKREDRARSRRGRANVWRLGRELFGARRGFRRLRRRERFRGHRFRCGAFQYHGRGSCGQRLHGYERQHGRLTAATPAPRNSASPTHLCAGTPSSGPSGSVNVALDVASVLTVSLDRRRSASERSRPAIDPRHSRTGHRVDQQHFRLLARGRSDDLRPDRPSARVVGNRTGRRNAGRWTQRWRTRFRSDRTATGLTIGTKSASSAVGGDVWATNIGFSAPLPLVATRPLLGNRDLHGGRSLKQSPRACRRRRAFADRLLPQRRSAAIGLASALSVSPHDSHLPHPVRGGSTCETTAPSRSWSTVRRRERRHEVAPDLTGTSAPRPRRSAVLTLRAEANETPNPATITCWSY